MIRCARALIFGSVSMLAVGLMVHQPLARAYDDADDKAIKAAQMDVVDLAKAIEEGKDGKAVAVKIKKKNDELTTAMQVYKPRAKKGLGVGPAGPGDGIESKIISLGKRALAPAALDKQKADLIKMVYVNLAMVEVTKQYTPVKPKGGKGAKEWNDHLAVMTTSSKELLAALKAGDVKKVKAAAVNLNSSCNNCHSDFRD